MHPKQGGFMLYVVVLDYFMVFLVCVVFFSQIRWSMKGAFEFKHPLTMPDDWFTVCRHHLWWKSPQCFACWQISCTKRPSHSPLKCRALLNFSWWTVWATFHCHLGQETKHASVNLTEPSMQQSCLQLPTPRRSGWALRPLHAPRPPPWQVMPPSCLLPKGCYIKS